MAFEWIDDGVSARRTAGHVASESDQNDKAYREWLRFGAENDLLDDNPDASCKTGLTKAQIDFGRLVGLLIALAILLAPETLFISFSLVAFSAFSVLIMYRCVLLVAGFQAALRLEVAGKSRERTRYIWPKYTVLVPIFREPEAVPELIAALKGLDYPKRQLEVMILLEAEDIETLKAVEAETLRPHFKVVILPKGDIQTKPRALNFGLKLSTGQLIAIYDAEDAMHARQLKEAARAFQKEKQMRGRRQVACFQAPLIPHNSNESWVSAQFEQEYRVHFGLIVKGLSQLGLPVMLGGTSNHFDRAALEKVGAWDPYNVTEDADLGLRLAAHGYRVGSLSSPTFEEAPIGLRQWIGQRSRWIKGFIQTAGVFFRKGPRTRAKVMGWINYISALCLMAGSVLSAVFHGPFALLLVALIIVPGWSPPGEAIALCVTGFGLHIASVLASGAMHSLRALITLLTAPLYWPLQTLAAAKAIHELWSQPFFWDKTQHGLSRKVLARKRLRTL